KDGLVCVCVKRATGAEPERLRPCSPQRRRAEPKVEEIAGMRFYDARTMR
ncbi:hypothetical protein M885DRAFT_545326, partial [Pelagophyceae sp. CCMP2097]